jgi:EVE domain
MPPKKRGRPAGPTAVAPPRPTKRVRAGETSIMGEQNSSDVTESGRPRRSSAGEPDYNTKRPRAPNKTPTSSSNQTNDIKANVTRKRKAASKLFGKRKTSATAKPEPEPPATPKRGRGRPPTTVKPAPEPAAPKRGRGRPKSPKAATEPAVGETPATVKEPAGRPKKNVGKPVKAAGGSKTTTNATKSTKGVASKAKGVKASVKVENHKDDAKDSVAAAAIPNGTTNNIYDDADEAAAEATMLQYWVMKAEPDSRMVKGVDVKFSIDDFKEKANEGPVAWDGVRNHMARNNMRAMRKGDMAFFYHSNCKTPGIVGMMEIVGEHTTDGTYHATDSLITMPMLLIYCD